MLRFTTTDFATQCTDTARIDADTGTLRHVFHNRAGSGVDAIQAVVTFNQHAGAELAGRCAHAGHDGRRQRDFEGGHRIVETLDVVQACLTFVIGKQAHRHQDIQELRALVDFLGDTVLNQVFAFQLLDRGIREIHVTPVVEITIQHLKLFACVILQQMLVILAQPGQIGDMVKQMRRFKLAIGDFAQMENRQACRQILVIRGFFRNQVSGGFDDGFMDIIGADAIVKLDMGAQLHLRHRHIIQALCGPVDHAVNLVQIDRFLAAIALRGLHGFVL